MRFRFIFWLLVVLIFSLLVALGFVFIRSNMTYFILTEAITALSVVMFIILYNRLIKPYKIISDGMDLLKEQDFASRLREVGHKDVDRLVEIFNRMMQQLKNERLRVREQNQFLDLLINASPQGLIILDFDDYITQINPAGLRLLELESIDQVKGFKLEESGINIGKQLSDLQPDGDIVVRVNGIIKYRCIRSSFIDRGFAHPFILIEELTHELLKTEKESYESIIRMMAHEVNNSVAAVGSTLNVISDSLESDRENPLADVLPAVEASFDRCNHLSRFITNFADVVKIPPPLLSEVDLNKLIGAVEILSANECRQRNIRFVLSSVPENYRARIDSIQFEQVLLNLVKNACESIGADGEIRIDVNPFPGKIIVSDNGPGISDEVFKKLFTPFFTTKPSGQGIGLMFVREVLTNHGCRFSFKTGDDGWTRFEIIF